MFPVLALIFLLVPAFEIYLLIQVGSIIGALPTALLVILTAVIGVQLLKSQGLSTLARAQQRMQQGEMPAQELLEGLALVIAGAFLLTPGFFTDSIGFLLLFPLTRSLIIAGLSQRLIQSGKFHMHTPYDHAQGKPKQDSGQASGDVIDGVNYRRHDEESLK